MDDTRRNQIAAVSEATTDYVSRLRTIDNVSDISAELGRITRHLGFDVFVVGQMPSVGYEGANFRITNYPEAFIRDVYNRFRFGDDPVLDAMNDAQVPFLWEDLPAFQSPTEAQRAYLAASEQHGLLRGYAVPVRVPGEPVGCVSFATRQNAPVQRDLLPFADHVAMTSFGKVRSITLEKREQKRVQTGLTLLELQCIKAFAQDKSDYVIAREVSIAKADISGIFKSAGQKLGFDNRQSILVRSLELGFLTFRQALVG